MRPAALVLMALGAALAAVPAEGQGVYIGSEPTVCPSPFRPISGLTFHEGEAWRVTWTTGPFQVGRAFYQGTPDPVLSQDGTSLWWNPSLLAECLNHWYQQPDGSHYVIFNWHVVSYQGRVVSENCGGEGGGGDPIYLGSYDPYAAAGPEDELVIPLDCSGGGGGGGDGSGGGEEDLTCHWEWIVIEASTDGGATWFEWWSGWATVCELGQT
jgi:hypothetical protein